MIIEAFGPFKDATTWVAISFVLFAILFAKKGVGPLLGRLDAHIGSIKSELDKAEQLKQDAAHLLAEYKEKHAQALSKAEDIIAETRSQAARHNAKLEADFKEALARREAQLTERLARIEQAAADEIRQMVAGIAVQTAHQALSEGAMTDKAQAALVQSALSNLSAASIKV